MWSGMETKPLFSPTALAWVFLAQIEVGVMFLNISPLMMCTWRCCIMLHPFQRVCRVQCHNSAEERENLSSEPLMSHVDVACGRMSSVDQLFDAEAGWISDDFRWFQHWNEHCSKASCLMVDLIARGSDTSQVNGEYHNPSGESLTTKRLKGTTTWVLNAQIDSFPWRNHGCMETYYMRW